MARWVLENEVRTERGIGEIHTPAQIYHVEESAIQGDSLDG